jgi:hypothetical protein
MLTEQFEADGGHSNDVEGIQDNYDYGELIEAGQQGAYGGRSHYGGDHNQITSASRCFLL